MPSPSLYVFTRDGSPVALAELTRRIAELAALLEADELDPGAWATDYGARKALAHRLGAVEWSAGQVVAAARDAGVLE